MLFGMAPRRPKRRPSGPKTPPQDDPRGGQVAPRPPQERLKRLRDAAKRAPGGPKRSPRDPRSRSRGLKPLQDRPKRLEKNTITKTMVHINVADIAEIDKDKTLLARGAVRKRRAGAGVPPWGRQSAARPGGARQRRVRSWFLKALAHSAKLQSAELKFALTAGGLSGPAQFTDFETFMGVA